MLDSLEHGGLDEVETVWRDMVMLALAGFIAIVIMVLPHIHPPGKKNTETMEPPGSVIIEIRWPDDINADVDLWAQAPGDVPVGYSNKGGKVFNLLRDDLGTRGDASGFNYENMFSRGINPGEYTVNVHLYRNVSKVPEIPVVVILSVKKDLTSSMRQLAVTTVILRKQGQEITAFRLRLTDKGNLVPGSLHHIYKPLRSARIGASSS